MNSRVHRPKTSSHVWAPRGDSNPADADARAGEAAYRSDRSGRAMVDYSKWDNMDLSDDEEKPVSPARGKQKRRSPLGQF